MMNLRQATAPTPESKQKHKHPNPARHTAPLQAACARIKPSMPTRFASHTSWLITRAGATYRKGYTRQKLQANISRVAKGPYKGMVTSARVPVGSLPAACQTAGRAPRRTWPRQVLEHQLLICGHIHVASNYHHSRAQTYSRVTPNMAPAFGPATRG